LTPEPVLQSFLRQAADAAERTTARIRIVILLLVQLRLLVVALPQFFDGTVKHWFTTAVIALGIGASVWMVRAVTRAQDKDRLLMSSTVLDAVLAFLIVLPGVLWPRVGYIGVLAAPDFGIWPIVATGAGLRLSPRAALAGSGAAMAGVIGLVTLDELRNSELIAYRAPEVALAIVLMIGATLFALGVDRRIRGLVERGAEEALRAERARQRLGAYVSEEVAAHVLRNPELVADSEQREAAVLFSDLRGFTRTGEELGPEELIAQLNAYLEAMVPAIRASGGVVDKYMGDAILAVFGVPEGKGDEAGRAIAASVSMERALEQHNVERAKRGLPPLRHGIGVHFGWVAAGHVGTRERLQYTVIGDTVNVASRLQTATKEVGVSVLLSSTLVERAVNEGGRLPPLRSLPPIELRGRHEAVSVCTFQVEQAL
jgi:class 3 adenylate cyclase